MRYIISINGLRCEDVDEFKDVVTHVKWRLTGTTPDGYEGAFEGATPIEDLSQLDSLTFVPYSELTEEEIIGWIESFLGADKQYKDHILDRIDKQIYNEKRLTTVEENNLPWKTA